MSRNLYNQRGRESKLHFEPQAPPAAPGASAEPELGEVGFCPSPAGRRGSSRRCHGQEAEADSEPRQLLGQKPHAGSLGPRLLCLILTFSPGPPATTWGSHTPGPAPRTRTGNTQGSGRRSLCCGPAPSSPLLFSTRPGLRELLPSELPGVTSIQGVCFLPTRSV